jgi:adenine phosphoribosyltransferase
MDYKDAIRTIPDYPKPGIMFRDITTLLGNPRAFRRAVDEMVQPYAGMKIDKVAGMEARGFILGGAVAHQLSVGFVPVRKKGKLPHTVIGEDYQLEYGTDRVEIHVDALEKGERVLLVERAGANEIGCSFVIDLPELGGADKLRAFGKPVTALVAFEGH